MTREKPPHSSPDNEVRAPRRHAGGARREASERVLVRTTGFETNGWTLNVSRGGIRAVVEDPLLQGIEYQLLVGDEETATARRATVAWLQDEADGQIVGLKYLDVEDGSVPPKDG
ncbi:MAG: PilZ domain-containing protein [Myxococcales bacterium]